MENKSKETMFHSPILGSQYACYRDGNFIGIATFVNDKNHGNCMMMLSKDCELMPVVADFWGDLFLY